MKTIITFCSLAICVAMPFAMLVVAFLNLGALGIDGLVLGALIIAPFALGAIVTGIVRHSVVAAAIVCLANAINAAYGMYGL
jgi:hypothetical protein